MEVHHHPQLEHKPKPWKEYILEYLMIFLAVTTGFFAESLREHITDKAKEKEYIISMIEDAKTDTANIHHAIELNRMRALHLDSAATICMYYDAAKNEDADLYRFYRYGLVHPTFISPTERTLQQLKNAGGMRLIRNKAAVDSIIQYDDVAKKLADQQAYYELYQNQTVNIATQVFNFKMFGFTASGLHVQNGAIKDTSSQLINRDKMKLVELGNMLMIYEGVVSFYNVRLQEMDKHATALILALKKAYNLEDE